MSVEPKIAWSIDECLQLQQIENYDFLNYQRLETPEQSIDTILHRNSSILSQYLFQQNSKFIYHSADYWGEFDVCLQLENRDFLAIEDKGRKLSKKDFQKFIRDITVLRERGLAYIQMRYEHVLKYYQRYLVLAERMFAAFFLGVRCDIEKNLRNLTDEACNRLEITPEVFQQRLRDLNQWLISLAQKPDFNDYTQHLESTPFRFHPILLVPEVNLASVQTWIGELAQPLGIQARIVTYRFYSQHDYPQYLSIEDDVAIAI